MVSRSFGLLFVCLGVFTADVRGDSTPPSNFRTTPPPPPPKVADPDYDPDAAAPEHDIHDSEAELAGRDVLIGGETDEHGNEITPHPDFDVADDGSDAPLDPDTAAKEAEDLRQMEQDEHEFTTIEYEGEPDEEGEMVLPPDTDPEVLIEDEHLDHDLPYPVLNDHIQIGYLHEEDSTLVTVNVEWSFFKGATKYEVCCNCKIDSDRITAEVNGGQKDIFEGGLDTSCEFPGSCFGDVTYQVGQEVKLSIRAELEEGKYTPWSPLRFFTIGNEPGVTMHTEL